MIYVTCNISGAVSPCRGPPIFIIIYDRPLARRRRRRTRQLAVARVMGDRGNRGNIVMRTRRVRPAGNYAGLRYYDDDRTRY